MPSEATVAHVHCFALRQCASSGAIVPLADGLVVRGLQELDVSFGRSFTLSFVRVCPQLPFLICPSLLGCSSSLGLEGTLAEATDVWCPFLSAVVRSAVGVVKWCSLTVGSLIACVIAKASRGRCTVSI